VHCAAPATDQLPDAQAAQVDVPPAEAKPDAHAVQVASRVAVPGVKPSPGAQLRQGVQLSAAAPEKVSSGQRSQVVAPSVAKVPAAQAEQVPDALSR
jgi:hypothetical protein